MIDPKKKYTFTSVSCTQMGAFLRDPYYWGLAYLEKLPRCSSEALEFGIKAHSYFEDFLNTRVLKKNEILSDFMGYFLENIYDKIKDKDITVEKKIGYNLESLNLFLNGRLDVYVEDYYLGCPLIADFKFLSNRKWGYDGHTVKSDLQFMLYSYCILQRLPETVKGVWLNRIEFYKNKKPICNNVKTFVHRIRVEEYFKTEIFPKLLQMKWAFANAEVDGLNALTKDSQRCFYFYGPMSCEFEYVYTGHLTFEEYRTLYSGLGTILGRRPRCKDLLFTCKDWDLTKKIICDIIRIKGKDDEALLTHYKEQVEMNMKKQTTNKTAAFSELMISPEVEILFSHLVKPTEDLNGKPRYEVNLKLDPNSNERHKAFLDKIKEMYKQAEDALTKLNPETAFRKLKLRMDKDSNGEETGKVLMKVTTRRAPGFVDGSNAVTVPEFELPHNTKVRTKLMAKTYNWAGSSGLSFYIQKVQILEVPERKADVDDFPSTDAF